MVRSRPPRLWVSGACYVALAAFATLARGIPVVERGPFALDPGQTVEIYVATAPMPTLAAVTVSTESGDTILVRPEGPEQCAPPVPVPPSRTCVLEGRFARVNLEAPNAPGAFVSLGAYEVRTPTDGPDADRLLGAGTIDLLPGTSYGVYGSYDVDCVQTPRARLLAVDLRANASAASILSTGGTPPPAYVIDGGDWGFCSRLAKSFRIRGTGVVPFAVYDPSAGCTPIRGIARAQSAQDRDSIDVDGQRDLEVSLLNRGGAPVEVTYALEGGADRTATIDPAGTFTPPAGRLSKLEWTYGQTGDAVHLSIRGR